MTFAQYLVVAVLQVPSLVHGACIRPKDPVAPSQPHRCSVSDPPPEFRDSLLWFEEQERTSMNLWNSSSIDRATEFRKSSAIQVDTFIHVIATNDSARPDSPNYISELQLINTFAYLSLSYNNTAINFNLKNITRTINDGWSTNADDVAMKRALRQGTYSALNIYYQDKLSDDGGLLGFCTLPTDAGTDYVTDGCNILSGTVAGGTIPEYSTGATTVHEVGHFFGLLHTFEGNTCSNSSWGDYVSDTPQQSEPTFGCPTEEVDTCTDSGILSTSSQEPGSQGYAGPDAVHNFMNYSNDECLDEFTAGQTARMLNMWERFRKGK